MIEGRRFEPAGRLAQFMRMVDAFERDEVEAAVDRLIDILDRHDGDTDREPAGDEMDASAPEGWQGLTRIDPLALASEDAEDDDSDRCAGHDDAGGDSVTTFDHAASLPGDPDDAEDDDSDTGNAEDEVLAGFMVLDGGPGCTVSDPPAMETAELEHGNELFSYSVAFVQHRARSQATHRDGIRLPYRHPDGTPAIAFRLGEREA